jgi:hypothetical protein
MPSLRGPQAQTTLVVRDGVYAALEQGPATGAEIERRMGFKVPGMIASLMRQLIHDGTVRVVRVIRGTHANGRGYRANVYALVDGSIEESGDRDDG